MDFTNELDKCFDLVGMYCNRADYKKTQENAKSFLKEAYHITDCENFFECIRSNQNLNMNGYISDTIVYLNDKSCFDISKLE